MSHDTRHTIDQLNSLSVLKRLNKQVGCNLGDVDQLQSLKDSLSRRCSELEDELAISNTASVSQLALLLKRSQTASQQAGQLQRQYAPLGKQCDAFVDQHSQLVVEVSPLLASEEARLKEQCYRALTDQLQSGSERIRQCLSGDGVEAAVSEYCALFRQTTEVTAGSRCVHLVRYCRRLVSAWYARLRQTLAVSLDAVLAELHYPFISTNVSVHQQLPGPDTHQRLERQLQLVARLGACCPDVSAAGRSSDFPTPCLPVQMLIRPLAMRFAFHFRGDKRTNCPEKPEWYMNQVLQWIVDHDEFLLNHVEPALNECLPDTRPRHEFRRALVWLMADKLSADLTSLQYDDAAMSHALDEALQTERRLTTALRYPGPGVLHVFRRPDYFQRWLHVEGKYARERMDQLLAADTAWHRLPGGATSHAVTEAADGILTLLQSITDRYSLLSEAGDRLQFLQLQLELLDDLRVRLLQLFNRERHDPLSDSCAALVNSAHHVRSTLQDWSERPFFLQLQWFRSRAAADKQQDATLEVPVVTMDEALDPGHGTNSQQLQPTLDDVDCTVFDGSIELLGRIETDVLDLMVDEVAQRCRSSSRPYRKDSWFSKPPPDEFITPTLSSSACPMMRALTQGLHGLENRLSGPLFDRLRQQLATRLCDHLFSELLLANSFSAGGAGQLEHDVQRCLAPVLGVGPLRLLLDACRLLTAPFGVALLLRDTLRAGSDQPDQRRAALNELGVHALSDTQALDVLQRRTDIAVIS